MTEPATAIFLMRMALALLDRNGMTIAACHLEHAINTASDPTFVGEGHFSHDVAAVAIRPDAMSRQPEATLQIRA